MIFFVRMKYKFTHTKRELPFYWTKRVIMKHYVLRFLKVYLKSTSTEINFWVVDQINAYIAKSHNFDLPIFDCVIWNSPPPPPPSACAFGNHTNSSSLPPSGPCLPSRQRCGVDGSATLQPSFLSSVPDQLSSIFSKALNVTRLKPQNTSVFASKAKIKK